MSEADSQNSDSDSHNEGDAERTDELETVNEKESTKTEEQSEAIQNCTLHFTEIPQTEETKGDKLTQETGQQAEHENEPTETEQPKENTACSQDKEVDITAASAHSLSVTEADSLAQPSEAVVSSKHSNAMTKSIDDTAKPKTQKMDPVHTQAHEITEQFGSAEGRVVLNAVPAMNSQPYDRLGGLTKEFGDSSVQDAPYEPPQLLFQRRANPPQSSIYHRNLPVKKENAPSWYVPPNRPVTRSEAPPFCDLTDVPTPLSYAQPPCDSPQSTGSTRKRSTSTPYIGSHVIAAETGPSLTIALRRPTSERQWGFTFYGGAEYGCPPFVNKVVKNSLAFRNGLEVGDVIVSICQLLTVGKTQEQLKAEILRAGNELDLVLIRRGIDLDKVKQCVPQALTPTAYGPTQPTSPVSSSVSSPEASNYGQNVTRGRSFRNVKTKSLRILEEQLSTGQSPSSVLTTKQHFQGARGLPAGGATSTFTTAYGQTPDQGYSGRIVNIQPTNISVVQQLPASPVAHTTHQSGYFPHQVGSSFDHPVYQSGVNWDTQSERSYHRTDQAFNMGGYGTQSFGTINASPYQKHAPVVSAAITVPIQRNQPRTDWAGTNYIRPNPM